MKDATMTTAHEAHTNAQTGWCGNVRFAVLSGAQLVSLPIMRTDAKWQPSGPQRGDPA